MATKSWGQIAILVGIVGLVASMAMDTSVQSGFGRVNNLGLMKDQQNYIMISIGILVVGAILLLKGPSKPERVTSYHTEEAPDTKTCPECAETILLNAKVCRYCGNRQFPEAANSIEASDEPYEPPVYRPRPKQKTVFERLFWSSADPNHPGNKFDRKGG